MRVALLFRLKCVVACVLALSFGQAKASTYDVQAAFTFTSGSVPSGYTLGGFTDPSTVPSLILNGTIDIGSLISSVDLQITPAFFSPVLIGSQGPVGSNLYHLQLLGLQGACFSVCSGNLVFPTPTGDLTNYFGGPIQSGFLRLPMEACNLTGDCPTIDFQYTLANGSISLVTPLPAALPLFATGLGALGLLAWRRKRKVVGEL